MTAWSEYTTGERIKILRGLELTQAGLADAAGVSLALVQKAERGRDISVASLIKIAEALGSDVGVLLGQQAPRRAMSNSERTGLRAVAIAVHDAAVGEPSTHEPPTLADLERARAEVWNTYWAGDYPSLCGIAAPLIGEARAFVDMADGRQRERGLAVLADALQVAACVANMLGKRDLAYAATAHAMRAAEDSGDELLQGVLASMLAWVYLRDGRVDRAVKVSEDMAASLEPRFGDASPQRLAVFGNLMLRAAVASARRTDKPRALDFLSQCHAAAVRLGADANHYQTQFGPTTARIQAVQVHLAFGDVGQALELIEQTHIPSSIPKVTRSRFKLDVALARVEAKQWDAAADTLLEVCMEAPGWVKHQGLAGVVAQRLGDGSTAKLRKVTQVLGVPLLTH
ncbi:helix-turn-helix domain-containing protein [Actinomadura litoris]|uniref:helix-turn-helix domain-containing protein n=1 Tax=Actinomadura litoris TaxID=2678616 RepID=UPI001FA6EE1C|nr:helix-turn-helix transcriptional regulator [Actinomadura litoris]